MSQLHSLTICQLFMSNHLTGYYNHILGAAVILKSRQSEHLTSPTAAMAFILTRNEIVSTRLHDRLMCGFS